MSVLDLVKAHTPWAIRNVSRSVKRKVRWVRNGRQPIGKVFDEIYRQNKWGGQRGNFYSGPGSDGDAARVYSEGIKALIAEQDIRTVVDLGCGDFRVAQQFLNTRVSYTGVDVVETLIRENMTHHPNANFLCLDIVQDRLPPGDLCLIREVFQHLSNSEVLQVLPKLSVYKYVVYTDYQPGPGAPCTPNRDIAHGVDTRIWRDSALFLDLPPFNRRTQLLFEAPATTVLRRPGERIRTYRLWP
jgi:hypothetical protein